MNHREVVAILQQQAKIEPGFTGLVWQKLEEQNPDFFKAYYARLRLKDQIVVFNQLLEEQCGCLRNLPHNSLSLQPHSFPTPQTSAASAYFFQNACSATSPVDLTQNQPPYSGAQDQSRTSVPNNNCPAIVGIVDNNAMRGAQGPLQPVRSPTHGEVVLRKQASFEALHTPLTTNLQSAFDNDGLMGGLNMFPRTFSLSDLTLDLNTQSQEGDNSLAMISGLQEASESARIGGCEDSTRGGLPRNFSMSDMNLDFGGSMP